MTTQVPDVLLIDGAELNLHWAPLDRYDATLPPERSLHRRRDVFGRTTACHRGYVGRWAVEDGRLMLRGLESPLPEEADRRLPLAEVFPGCPGRVFAHWLHAVIRCSEGETIHVWPGFRSRGERDHYLWFEAGVLRDRLPVDPPADPDAEWYHDDEAVLTAFGIPFVDVEASPDDTDDRPESHWLVDRPGACVEPLEPAAALAFGRTDGPPDAVPEQPFGHLNPAWQRLLGHLVPGTSLVHAFLPLGLRITGGWPTMSATHGLCVVRDGVPVHEFVFAGD